MIGRQRRQRPKHTERRTGIYYKCDKSVAELYVTDDDGFLPGSGLGGRGRAVHGDWPGEVDQTAGAAETGTGGPREWDVGILIHGQQMNSPPLHPWEELRSRVCVT